MTDGQDAWKGGGEENYEDHPVTGYRMEKQEGGHT